MKITAAIAAVAMGLAGKEVGPACAVPLVIGTVILGNGFSQILPAFAGSAMGRRQGRYVLWAKLLLILAGMLSLGIPLAVYGGLQPGMQLSILMDPHIPDARLNPLDPRLINLTVFVAGAPFLLGLMLLAPALIWGRGKRQPVKDRDMHSGPLPG
ncbi:MAG TPA: hypothetical protein VGM59_02280 [Dongiaceae bacterium]